MKEIASQYTGCGRTILIAGLILVFGVITLTIPNFAQAADDPAPAVDAANHADVSIDNLVLPSALEAQQDTALDQAFAALPATTPEGTTPTVNAEAIVAQRLAAIQDSAQEAATLGYGAPVAGPGGRVIFGTEAEHGHEGRTHEEAGCLDLFHDSVGIGFGSLTQGLPVGALPPETVARFEAMHERFEQMAASFQGMMFGGARGEAGGLPPGPGGPLPGGPIGGPEGATMPAGMPAFQVGDLGTMFGAAALGVDPAQFAQSMSQMIEARATEATQAYFAQGGPGEHGALPGLGGGTFAGFTPGGDNPLAAFLPGVTGGATAGSIPANAPPELVAAVSLAIAEQIHQQIAENIAQKIETQILNNLPPEALKTKEALDANFTASDLATLQGGTPSISRAFSAEITDRFKNTSGVSVDFPGQEHIHVTYTYSSGGDGLYPGPHTDANVTAIHSEDHTQTADLTGAGADHIPNIQA